MMKKTNTGNTSLFMQAKTNDTDAAVRLLMITLKIIYFQILKDILTLPGTYAQPFMHYNRRVSRISVTFMRKLQML